MKWKTHQKSLLVLAASYYQLETIHRARSLGYRVITLDNRPDNPGHRLADESYLVDTTDRQRVLEIALKENIDGVIAVATDVAVPTAAFIAERLHLPGPPLKSAETMCNKLKFRDFQDNHGLCRPDYFSVTEHKLPDRSQFFWQKWIIKPDQSSGSKGVFILNDWEDFHLRFPEALSFSPERNVIVEKYIEGFQGTVEGVLEDGTVTLAVFLDKQVRPYPYTATCGHHVPTRLSSIEQQEVIQQIQQVCHLLEISHSLFDCDFIISDNDIHILEISPRIGGNLISRLLYVSAGIDITAYGIRLACGDRAELPNIEEVKPTATILLGVQEGGRLRYDTAQALCLKKEPWVDQIAIDISQNHEIEPFKNGNHRIGEVIITGATRDHLDLLVQDVQSRLDLRTM